MPISGHLGGLLVFRDGNKPLWKALNNSPFDLGYEAPPRENMDAQSSRQRPHTPRKRPSEGWWKECVKAGKTWKNHL